MTVVVHLKVAAVLAALGASGALHGSTVFRLADPAITESSGLVDLGSLMVTTNDSGGDPLVFVLDSRGETVGRTTYTSSVTDTEALAPAGAHAVWVGDIGDNNEVRPRVQVYRVPVGRGDRTVAAPSYDLVYPDGPHDAESLLYGPDHRLRIVTKGILGGQVYVAPKVLHPDRANRLQRGPAVALWATDAALFPDGKHVIVRGYSSALVATYPAFGPVGYVEMPEEKQGEGVSVGSRGRIRLSSEGEHSRVLQIQLPARLQQVVDPLPAHPGPLASAHPGSDAEHQGVGRPVLVAAAVAAGSALLVGLAWRRRRR